jgi:hypothetical protein
MATTTALDFVDRVGDDTLQPFATRAAAPTEADRLVVFRNTGSAKLPDDSRQFGLYKRALERWKELQRPVFLVLDERNVIVDVRAPFVGTVVRLIRAGDGSYQVGLDTSAVRFILQPRHPGFSTALADLKTAQRMGTPMIITATDRHLVLDVRPDDSLRWFRLAAFISNPVLGNRAIAQASQVTAARAKELFDEMQGESCDVATGPQECIPFLYPEDGCWARADRVCDLLSQRHSLRAAKVWIHGDLSVPTSNSPFCEVIWDWHVAPALRIGTGQPARLAIIDPGVSAEGPLSRRAWKSMMGDKAARISITDAEVFRQATEGQFAREPQGQGSFDLKTYRNLLEQRADEDGPPPYLCGL